MLACDIETDAFSEYNFDELLSLAEEIKRILISSINTAKEILK